MEQSKAVLSQSTRSFAETTLDQVASCLKYEYETVTLDDMQKAIKRGAMEQESAMQADDC